MLIRYFSFIKMWDRDQIIARNNVERKIRPTGYIYLPGSKYREAESHLIMRSCLKDDVIISAPGIGQYINKLGLYKQCHPRRVKDTKMSEIENTSCVRSIMNVTQVIRIEGEPWGEASTPRIFNGEVYKCTCSVRSDEYMCKKKHAFVFVRPLKPLH